MWFETSVNVEDSRFLVELEVKDQPLFTNYDILSQSKIYQALSEVEKARLDLEHKWYDDKKNALSGNHTLHYKTGQLYKTGLEVAIQIPPTILMVQDINSNNAIIPRADGYFPGATINWKHRKENKQTPAELDKLLS